MDLIDVITPGNYSQTLHVALSALLNFVSDSSEFKHQSNPGK